MSIRRAKPSHARGIAEVHVAAWRSAYRGLLPDDVLDRLTVEEVEGRWKERLSHAWRHVFVAQENAHDGGHENGRVVGFAGCGPVQDEEAEGEGEEVGEIYVVYVHPETWRQGYGSALLDGGLAGLRDDGFAQAILWVLRDNRQAIGFYEAMGFAADGGSKTKRRADGTEMPLVRYRRRLP